ncbi:DUF349 domain-containing protein [Botryobacter ruber]|uniref:DUF349 domain-containing protein n=1 Tax=Botryobacter ruber TaxID=2171629 RepID=UPI000E0A6F1C|nr:DUF349 domain-containing protein [Botryobacter ruber]
MTTENQNIDSTGAEARKPENQNDASLNQNNAETPQEILQRRLDELGQKQPPQDTAPAAQPQQQEEAQSALQPEATEPAESEAITAKTDAMVAAQESAGEPQPSTAAEATPASQAPEKNAHPVVETTQRDTIQAHEEEEEEEETDSTDYSQLSMEELRHQLIRNLKSADARKKHRLINELNQQYDLKFQAERSEALERYKQEQGDTEDFEYHAPQEHQDLEKLLVAYRDARYQERQQTEAQRQKNLERKQELLNKLRELVESAETKTSGEELKKIQTEWKSIGPVPAGEAQQLWDSYHALLDIFYNNRSIFYELKELDRKRNLDAKLQLIDRAEALQQEQSLNKALQELRHLHEEWKNIGPVPNEQREPIWERFIQASEKIHENRRAYQEERRVKEMENLTKKRDILERLSTFQNFNTDRINEWRDRTDEIQKLKEEWDAVGLVPKEFAEEVNKTFWSNYKTFFQHKNMFFKSLDEQKMHNLQLKTQLCEEAESLKDSTDWNATKEKLIQLQKQWKTIGRVPDKHSDKIWNRFRAACNEFFDRKQAFEKQKGEEFDRMSIEKMEICDRISEKLAQPTAPTTLEEFDSFVSKWRTLDSMAPNNPKSEEKFLKLMERFLEREPTLSYEERNDILVKLQVERLKHIPDAGNKLHQREQTIRREIAQLQNDIQTLKTNIEFFARSKNADKLREEYEGRISDAQRRIELLQRQQQAFRE